MSTVGRESDYDSPTSQCGETGQPKLRLEYLVTCRMRLRCGTSAFERSNPEFSTAGALADEGITRAMSNWRAIDLTSLNSRFKTDTSDLSCSFLTY